MNNFWILLRALIFFSFIPLFSVYCEFSEFGTLIVTYQADQANERLDRIRFWLINSQNERVLHPQKDQFVTNTQKANERTVVITHLPVGNYTIHFLIPNKDQFFEEVASRKFMINTNEVTKVDQTLRTCLPKNFAKVFPIYSSKYICFYTWLNSYFFKAGCEHVIKLVKEPACLQASNHETQFI